MVERTAALTVTDLTPRDIHPWVAEGQKRVRFGISVYRQLPDWQKFIELVQRIEELGFDGYFVYDHPRDHTDAWTSLAALAASTSRIRLGLAVGCIYYRSPYLLARQAADVDRLSSGRLVLGLGIGHVGDEFREMGIPFPDTKTRLQGMDETIAIVRGLWSGQPFSHQGEQWNVDAPGTFLGPIQQPRVPILLAGGGEKVTLRQVARYADASNMGAHASIGTAVTDDDIVRKFDKLREYCEEFGRPYESILRSQFTMPLILASSDSALKKKLAGVLRDTLEWCGDAVLAATPDDAIAFYRRQHQLGYQYFIGNILEGDDETIELLGTEVIPAFAGNRT
jgi:alkanesulfonate monooxygenase SsuD/methylene tetrahydromethanopterin reductase-like flavin-dependent oxidoreductase (luciferase family)